MPCFQKSLYKITDSLDYNLIFHSKEAAVCVQQGLDNEAFMDTMPPKAYKILHHRVCYWLIFLVTLILLLLAFFEQPSHFPHKSRADKAVSILVSINF